METGVRRLAGLAVIGLACAAQGESRWGGGESPNCVSAARGLPETLEGVRPLWEVKLGSHQYTIPTVAGGCLYLGVTDDGVAREGYRPSGGGAVICLDLTTHLPVWTLPIPRNMEGVRPPYHFDQFRCGVCSGPLVHGDRVFVVGNRGDVLCLDRLGQANGNDGPFTNELAYMGVEAPGAALGPGDGDIVWRFDCVAELNCAPHDTCASTPLLLNGLLYVDTSNGLDEGHAQAPRPDAPMLVALDARTGRLVAKDDERIGARLLHGSWSSPCCGKVGGKTLVFMGGGDGFLYAFCAVEPSPGGGVQTLKKAWMSDCNPPHFRERDGKKLEYSGWNHRHEDGPSEPITTPVFDAGRLYVAIGQSPLHGLGNGCLTCFDASTGAVVWRSEAINRTLSTVALSGGVIYLPDSEGTLHAFDAANGQTLWTHPLEGPVNYANARVADGKVFVGTENGHFWIFREGREKTVLSHSRLPSPPITVSAADGVLFVPLQNRLSAFAGPSSAK